EHDLEGALVEALHLLRQVHLQVRLAFLVEHLRRAGRFEGHVLQVDLLHREHRALRGLGGGGGGAVGGGVLLGHRSSSSAESGKRGIIAWGRRRAAETDGAGSTGESVTDQRPLASGSPSCC